MGKLRRTDVQGEVEDKKRDREGAEGGDIVDLPNIFRRVTEKAKFTLLTPRLLCIQPLNYQLSSPPVYLSVGRGSTVGGWILGNKEPLRADVSSQGVKD